MSINKPITTLPARLIGRSLYLREQGYGPTSALLIEAADTLHDCARLLKKQAHGRNAAARMRKRLIGVP